MRILKNILVAVFCVFILSFCKRANTTWDDDLVAPLATGSLTLGNLFPDTVIKANADSSLKIAFTSNLINYGLDSLLKIPDTTITIFFNFPGNGYPISPGLSIPLTNNAATETPYNLPSGIQLKKAIIRQGGIHFLMKNTAYRPLVYHYQLLSATKNNHILDTTFNIPAADSATGVSGPLSGYINLSGYTIDFSGLHNGYNRTVEIDSVHIAPYAQPGFLYVNQGFNASFTFENIAPEYAQGYFGSQNITVGPDTTAFTAFSSIKQGMLNLNSANVTLTIKNQFGVGMSALLSNILSINSNIPNTVPLTATPLNSAVNIASASNTGSGATTTTKVISLSNSNSNVKDFIGNLPGKLAYKLTAQLNPNGNLSGSNDFGYYGTSFSADLNMDVPLFFSASNLMLADTVTLNLSTVGQLQNINHGNLILTATNSYPFSINLNAVLLDEYRQPIDVLFNNPNLIEAPPLDINNRVISPLKSKLYVPLTAQKIKNLQAARYVYYTATFNTANQPNQVKFYSNYTLDLLLTADLNYTIGK